MAASIGVCPGIPATKTARHSIPHEYYFTRVSMEMSQGGSTTADISMILERTPRDQKDLVEMICNKYLKECGLQDTIKEILEKYYSCHLI